GRLTADPAQPDSRADDGEADPDSGAEQRVVVERGTDRLGDHLPLQHGQHVHQHGTTPVVLGELDSVAPPALGAVSPGRPVAAWSAVRRWRADFLGSSAEYVESRPAAPLAELLVRQEASGRRQELPVPTASGLLPSVRAASTR